MQKVVISDTSVLIILSNISELDLLHEVYGEIYTTEIIAQEFGEPLPAWIKIEAVKDEKYLTYLTTQVDKGEASAMAVATQFEEVLLLMDDLKARKFAEQLKLKVTGVMGILVNAKKEGKIPAIKPLIEKVNKTNFRINQKIIDFVLAECGEL